MSQKPWIALISASRNNEQMEGTLWGRLVIFRDLKRSDNIDNIAPVQI